MIRKLTFLALALAAVGCDDSDFDARVSTEMLLDTNSLRFNRVPVGQFEQKPVEVRAGGQAPLTVSEIRLAAPYEQCDRVALGVTPGEPLPAAVDSLCEFIIDERPTLPAEKEVDDFFQVVVRYRPTSPETPAPTQLVITGNDPQNPTQVVEISVQGAQPRISVRPSVLSFSGGAANQIAQVIVTNVGTGTLNVGSFQIRRDNPAPTGPDGQPKTEWLVNTINEGGPSGWPLEERDAITFDVEYDPQDAGDDSAQLVFLSDDPEQPEVSVLLTSSPVFGILDARPNPLEFGDDTLNLITRKLNLSNTGMGVLEVLDMRLEPPSGDYSLGDEQRSFQLGGGDAREIEIKYQASTADGSDARLFIQHNGQNAVDGGTYVELVRTAMNLPATIGLEPGAVTWNDIAPGADRSQDVVLKNTGGQTLTITRAELTGDGDASGHPASDPEFSVTAGAISGSPVALEPGEEHTVSVRFDRPGDDAISHVGVLVVESNAGSSPDSVFFTVGAPAGGE